MTGITFPAGISAAETALLYFLLLLPGAWETPQLKPLSDS